MFLQCIKIKMWVFESLSSEDFDYTNGHSPEI